MNEPHQPGHEIEDLPEEFGHPQDNASAARSCLVVLLLTMVLVVVIGVYLIVSAVF